MLAVSPRAVIAALLLALIAPGAASAKRKDDRLVVVNGDRMTGEIKKFASGILSFKSDYMLSEVEVDWIRVQELESLDEFQIVLVSGLHVTGNLYWSFTLYENDDTQPPVNANKNDFGVTNSIGWKF